ncbi:hypothetical protein D1823_02325 [Ruegeria sp. AD91A]|uniref:hypothetical protein n=1 Tax=Ruegeria sp. AD91A TaxID=2293862 RepID=UPI000E4B6FCC|nr:hypothetical protein [Ruegeria sp. AD91A]AXT25534.1 hypothetical protein D1823_02325 [Ruegeria sp. AD91A]
MNHNNATGSEMKIRWIRLFTSGLGMPNDGLPDFGDFVGTVDANDIKSIFPCPKSNEHLFVLVEGREDNGTVARDIVLKTDLFAIFPDLAVTFP